MADWKQLSTEDVYKTAWIRVRRDEVLNHTGKHLTYSVIELVNPSVYVIATDDQGRVYLHRNYRYPLGKYLWDIPAGHAESNDFLADAKRELQEEAGLASNDWEELGVLYQAAGIGSLPVHVFWARNVHASEGIRDELEDMPEHRFVSIKEIEAMAKNGNLQEISVLGAIYLTRLHGL